MNIENLTNMTVADAAREGRTAKPTMDSDGFMKLLLAGLRQQDPTSPQDNSEFMAQMSQMTMVEQITNLNDAAQRSQTIGLAGKTVTYRAADNSLVTGTVERVDVSGRTPHLTIGGVPGIKPAQLVEVAA